MDSKIDHLSYLVNNFLLELAHIAIINVQLIIPCNIMRLYGRIEILAIMIHYFKIGNLHTFPTVLDNDMKDN